MQEIPQVQMEGNPVRVSLTLLWAKPSTFNFYKINEGPYCATAAPKHSPNDMPGRYAHNGQISTGINLSLGHSDLAPAESGFVLNLKKSILESSQEIEFLGMVIGSLKMEILLPCKTNVTV